REVKPARADGIAVTGGRVGRCLFLYRSLCYTAEAFLCLDLFYAESIAIPVLSAALYDTALFH
ncbi:hypothetical protein, partial [Sphingobacterium sp. B16(2022)]|uniref:hypothetical protein n=1 Tax=Sphingobacterium sp. B16(2022) TaxID=2914044 RepID=UPI0019CFF356